MAAHRVVLLLLLALGVSAAAAVGAATTPVYTLPPSVYMSAQLCTPDQKAAYDAIKVAPHKCDMLATRFEVCDDDCLAHHTREAAQAPNCSIGGGDAESVGAAARLQDCENNRHWMSVKYMPKTSPGLRDCTVKERDAWENTTAKKTSFNRCGLGVTVTSIGIPTTYCSFECLKIIEDTISNAPQCVTQDQYAAGELAKWALVTCVKGTLGDLQTNKVLQTVVTADSKSVRSHAHEQRVVWGAAVLVAAMATTLAV